MIAGIRAYSALVRNVVIGALIAGITIAALSQVEAKTKPKSSDARTCDQATGDTAIAACTRAIDSGKYKGRYLAILHADRAFEASNKGQYDIAITDYTQAIELNPKYAVAYNGRGLAYRAKGDNDRALADYSQAIQLNPKLAVAYNNRANAYQASLIGRLGSSTFRLSTTAVSMSLTGSCFSSESAPGPSIMGFEDEAEQSIWAALPSDERQVQADIANSPHPSSREGHLSTAGWSSSFLLSDLILYGCHAAAACSRVHRNSVPSTQMRCMITAKPTGESHDCLLHPAAPGDLHRPGLEP